jgi:hypothetical protein
MPTVVHTTPSNSQTPTIPATTAGHALIVCVMGSDRGAPPVVTGVTLGGSATGWVALEASNDSFADSFAAVWANYNIAGGQTAVAISGTDLDTASGVGGVVVFEASGVLTAAALDQVSTDNTSDLSPTAAYTSGPAPPATTQASELWVGCANADNLGITGPGGWTNTAPTGGAAIAGYQVVSATGTPIYAGTCTSGGWSAVVVTLKGAATPANVIQRCIGVHPRRTLSRGITAKGAGQAFVAVPAPEQRPQAPRTFVYNRAVIRGGVGTRAAGGTPGKVLRQPVIPRMTLQRAVIGFRPVRTVNRIPVNGIVQSKATLTAPRMTLVRARVLFAPVTTVNNTAPPGAGYNMVLKIPRSRPHRRPLAKVASQWPETP